MKALTLCPLFPSSPGWSAVSCSHREMVTGLLWGHLDHDCCVSVLLFQVPQNPCRYLGVEGTKLPVGHLLFGCRGTAEPAGPIWSQWPQETWDRSTWYQLHFSKSLFEKTKQNKGTVNVYIFLHFSFQEFLSAVLYDLKNDSSWMFFDQVGKTWKEIFQQYGHGFSSLIIQFLFSLLHKGKGKAMETTFGRKVSLGLQEELLKWTEKEIKDKSSRLQIDPMDLFHCMRFRKKNMYKRITDDLQSIILLQYLYKNGHSSYVILCQKQSQSPVKCLWSVSTNLDLKRKSEPPHSCH